MSDEGDRERQERLQTVRVERADSAPSSGQGAPSLNITCMQCGGHDFLLALTLAGTTMLVCVNHEQHVEDLDPPRPPLSEVVKDWEEARRRRRT